MSKRTTKKKSQNLRKGSRFAPSPKKVLDDKFGGKEKLVDELLKTIPNQNGDSKNDFKARLMKVPSTKLIKLKKAEDRLVKKHGSRADLIAKIKENYSKFSKPLGDEFFKKFELYSSGKLMEFHKVTENKVELYGRK